MLLYIYPPPCYYIFNPHHAIIYLYQQVVPVPKARGVGLTHSELHRAGRSERRAQTKQEEVSNGDSNNVYLNPYVY
jgi:hypothetical protein